MAPGSRLVRFGALAVLIAVCAAAATARQFGRGRRGFASLRTPTADSFDGSFNFCRVMFQTNRGGDGGNWTVDYPRADVNLSIRFSELTKGRISVQPGGEPNHLIVNLLDPALFQCPFVMMTEVGTAYFDEAEALKLREYLQKGGFLWADDFWGEYAWDSWAREIAKVLPPNEYRIVDLPADHPLFRAQFEVKGVVQIPSINFWAGSGGGTSERFDSEVPHARGISDKHGRLMVLITHNTDYGDSWEREADDPDYFYRFSVDGYAFGINVLLYSMMH